MARARRRPALALAALALALALGQCAPAASSDAAAAAPAPAVRVPAAVIATGVAMPVVSLGTGGGDVGNRSVVRGAVRDWLLVAGGRGIDTAADYDNEDLVGDALADAAAAGVQREEIFLTTKQPGPLGYDATLASLEASLGRLRTTWVDLFLVHFPDPANATTPAEARQLRQDTWRAMEHLRASGKARAVGVSNFEVTHLKDVLDVATVVPAVNQVLFNPVKADMELLAFCDRWGITLEAWSPLGGHDSRHGEVLNLPLMRRVAAAHGVSTAQVALRWALQHGIVLTAGTTNPAHMSTNLDLWNFRLTDDEVAAISALTPPRGRSAAGALLRGGAGLGLGARV